MSWVAVGGMVVTAAGAAHQADQAGDAADAQIDSANAARRLTQGQFEQTREDLAPYRRSGLQAQNILSRTLGLGGGGGDLSHFEESPGYQFRLSEGNKALERSAAARGMTLSGAQLKSLGRYNQGMASQEFGNWFNRLSGMAGAGQNAATMTGQFGANSAANQGNYLAMAGQAGAEGIASRTNAITGGLEGLMTLGSQYANRNRSSGYQDNSGWWNAVGLPKTNTYAGN